MRKLNDKQKRFAREYVIDLNATRAAIRAGYSEKTAKSQGQRLLTNVDVSEFIKELMDQKIYAQSGLSHVKSYPLRKNMILI